MIINSLLDTDLYKFSMMQAVLHNFPSAEVEYTFKSRGNETFLNIQKKLYEEINHLCNLRFQPDELKYLSTIPFFTNDFIDFLSLFQLNEKYIEIKHERSIQGLSIKVKGPWLHTILFEVPILAIISELYHEEIGNGDEEESNDILENKLSLKIPAFADFGTRRRFSFNWHDNIISQLEKMPKNLFIGTSNLYFAKKYNLKPIGTMAHEWLQAGQALGPRLVDSQKFMLETWVQEYRGDLGIALTDVIGVDAFIKDFDLYFAKLYDGVRHDSGDPISFGEKIIEMYKNLRIDPMTKTIVFSDGLEFGKAIYISNHFKDKINVSFGIGTNLTCDLYGVTPLKIVMKMTKCNGQPVAKISDNPGKEMCEDEEYINYLKKVFKV